MKTKKKLRQLAAKRLRPINVWCVNGLCKGEVFQVALGVRQLRVATPANPFYKMAIYAITDRITDDNEHAAVFPCGVAR